MDTVGDVDILVYLCEIIELKGNVFDVLRGWFRFLLYFLFFEYFFWLLHYIIYYHFGIIWLLMINFDMGIIVRNNWKDYCYPFSLVCLIYSFSFDAFSSSFVQSILLSWSDLNHQWCSFQLLFTQVTFLHYKFHVFSKGVLKFTFLLFLQESFIEPWLIALSGGYWVDLFYIFPHISLEILLSSLLDDNFEVI